MFGESREEREVRIDGEHQALVKGRLSGHQFEPLFEASVADLDRVGRPRKDASRALLELPSQDASALAEGDPPGQADLAGRLQGSGSPVPCHVGRVPQWFLSTSSERRRTERWPTRRTRPRQGRLRTLLRPLPRRRRRSESSRRLPRRPRPGLLARPPKDSTLAAGPGAKGGGKGAASKICFHFRDHGNCPKGDSCSFSHEKELRKQALAAKRGESTLAAKCGSGWTLGSRPVAAALTCKRGRAGTATPPSRQLFTWAWFAQNRLQQLQRAATLRSSARG